MIYLGVQIRHDATPLGNIGMVSYLQRILTMSGKTIKTFVIGDEKISDSKAYLQKAIENYTRALSTFNTGLTLKCSRIVKGVNSFSPLILF